MVVQARHQQVVGKLPCPDVASSAALIPGVLPCSMPPVEEQPVEEQPEKPQWFREPKVIALCAACLVVGFLAAALLFDKPWRLPANWGDIPTWLAVVAASVAGWAAISQLADQRSEIRDEIARNRTRDQLMDRQLRELEDREQFRRREQAERIDMIWGNLEIRPRTSLIVVINDSRRPIRELTCQVFPDETGNPVQPDFAAEMYKHELPDAIWTMPDRPGDLPQPISRLESLRAGSRAGFEVPVLRSNFPGAYAKIEFSDDKHIRWRLFSDLSLSRTPDEHPPTGAVVVPVGNQIGDDAAGASGTDLRQPED
jgi:hypothetical protein